MFHYRPALLACGLAPLAAQSATIVFMSDLTAGQVVSEAQVINPNDEFEFRYTALNAFDIQSFAVSATGNAAGGDVADIRFGFTSPATNQFSTIVIDGTSAFGGAFLPGLQLLAGDVFSIFFSDGIVNPVALTLSFRTDVPAPVPLPASGGVLMLGLFGLLAYGARARGLTAKSLTDKIWGTPSALPMV